LFSPFNIFIVHFSPFYYLNLSVKTDTFIKSIFNYLSLTSSIIVLDDLFPAFQALSLLMVDLFAIFESLNMSNTRLASSLSSKNKVIVLLVMKEEGIDFEYTFSSKTQVPPTNAKVNVTLLTLCICVSILTGLSKFFHFFGRMAAFSVIVGWVFSIHPSAVFTIFSFQILFFT